MPAVVKYYHLLRVSRKEYDTFFFAPGRLRVHLQEETGKISESLAEDVHARLQTIMEESESMMQECFPPDSSGQIFWNE